MKIAFVANTSWNIYNFREGLVKKFIAEGNQVIVLAPKDEYTDQVISWGAIFFDTPMDGTGSNPIKDYSYFRRLKSVFSAEQPDVCLSFTIKSNIYSCLAAKLTATKVICNVSGLGTVFLVKGLVGQLAMLLYWFSFRFASHVFFQNEDDKDLFLTKIHVAHEKIGILPGSGIDLEEFEVQPYQVTHPLKVLMIARVIEEKGVREFAEAARMLAEQEVDFTLVGKHDENHSRAISKQELDQWVQEEWINYLPHSSEIKRLIKESEMVILPSYREGTPRTLLEAAAIGRAVIASNVAGCNQVVREGYNGFLFPVKSAEGIVKVIEKYLKLSTTQKESLAKNSRKFVEEVFDEKIVIDRYKSVIDQILPNG